MCKWSNQQRINLQNIHTDHSAPYKKPNSPIKKKIGWWPKQTFIQRRYTDAQYH